MYKTRIGSSDIKHYSFGWADQATLEGHVTCVATARVTAEQSIDLLQSEGCININFEMPAADFKAATADSCLMLRAALSDELIDGAIVVGSSSEWAPATLVTTPGNIVVSARIDIAAPLRRLVRSES